MATRTLEENVRKLMSIGRFSGGAEEDRTPDLEPRVCVAFSGSVAGYLRLT
jgi:hypothetical protein